MTTDADTLREELDHLIQHIRNKPKWPLFVILFGGGCLLTALSAFSSGTVTIFDQACLVVGIVAAIVFVWQTRQEKRDIQRVNALREELYQKTGERPPGI